MLLSYWHVIGQFLIEAVSLDHFVIGLPKHDHLGKMEVYYFYSGIITSGLKFLIHWFNHSFNKYSLIPYSIPSLWWMLEVQLWIPLPQNTGEGATQLNAEEVEGSVGAQRGRPVLDWQGSLCSLVSQSQLLRSTPTASILIIHTCISTASSLPPASPPAIHPPHSGHSPSLSNAYLITSNLPNLQTPS